MTTSAQARVALMPHGKLKSQPPEDWAGDFPLPPAIIDYYGEVGPVNIEVELYGDPVMLPRLSKLWKYQDGYRFVGRKREREPSWPDDWLVVADLGADPFILSRSTGIVMLDEHGAGAWEPVEIFPDILTMALCLGMIGAWVASDNRPPLRSDLTAILGDASAAAKVLSALGIADA